MMAGNRSGQWQCSACGRAEQSDGSERPLHPSVAHGEAAGSVLSSLVLFVLKRALNHDASGVAMVRSELSRDLVGLS